MIPKTVASGLMNVEIITCMEMTSKRRMHFALPAGIDCSTILWRNLRIVWFLLFHPDHLWTLSKPLPVKLATTSSA